MQVQQRGSEPAPPWFTTGAPAESSPTRRPSGLAPLPPRHRWHGVDSLGVTSPHGEPLDDPALLLRIASQDRAAFRVFYDRHAPRVLSVVRHMVPHPETAEDLMQDVFLLVWRKAGSYRQERGDVGGWLFTICRNRVADHFRSTPKTRRLETGEMRTLPAEAPAVADEMRMTLAEVLANLAPDQREAVDLAYFGGLTYEETAQQLAIPLGTLKSRVRTALARLRGALEAP